MSAYLCDTRHISAIVNAVDMCHYLRGYGNLERYLTNESAQTVRDGLNTEGEALYSDLLQTNLDSLAARYPDAPRLSDWGDDEGSYRLNTTAHYASAIAAIKGVECYRYQSCEHDGWATSKAKQFCDDLIANLISSVPGYENAAWGFEPSAVEG